MRIEISWMEECVRGQDYLLCFLKTKRTRTRMPIKTITQISMQHWYLRACRSE